MTAILQLPKVCKMLKKLREEYTDKSLHITYLTCKIPEMQSKYKNWQKICRFYLEIHTSLQSPFEFNRRLWEVCQGETGTKITMILVLFCEKIDSIYRTALYINKQGKNRKINRRKSTIILIIYLQLRTIPIPVMILAKKVLFNIGNIFRSLV